MNFSLGDPLGAARGTIVKAGVFKNKKVIKIVRTFIKFI
jgi:hypothetical protein